MWGIISAVVIASLLGSMHCVGMCGPLAIWSCGATEKDSPSKIMLLSGLYHGGRLITYAIAGGIAGLIGGMVDLGGEWIGVQLTAARVVGTLMILIGGAKLLSLVGVSRPEYLAMPSLNVGKLLTKMRPLVVKLPDGTRAAVMGMLTTLLPCGWLYLFAMFAAGTGNVTDAVSIMVAFWLGTLPALVMLVAGTRKLSRRFEFAIPSVAAILLILTGCFTVSGRGFSNAAVLTELEAQQNPTDVQQLRQVELPCCCHRKLTN